MGLNRATGLTLDAEFAGHHRFLSLILGPLQFVNFEPEIVRNVM